MSPSSCADRIHRARIVEIKEALSDIQEKHRFESANFELVQNEEFTKTITVRTHSLEVVASVESLLVMTPAWRENIIIDYSPPITD